MARNRLDTFNRPDRTDLKFGTIPYTNIGGFGNTGEISSRQLHDTDTAYNDNLYRADVDCLTSDHSAQIFASSVTLSTTVDVGLHVLCRLDTNTATPTGYMFANSKAGGQQILKAISNVFTVLSTVSSTSPATGDLLTGDVSGSTLTLTYNGTATSITDTAITSGLRCGFDLFRQTSAVNIFGKNFQFGPVLDPVPQVEGVLLPKSGASQGIQLAILGPPLFSRYRGPIFGTSAETLDAFTSNAYGQVAPQDMPVAAIIRQTVQGVQLPILGPPLFAPHTVTTVTGTIAATLDAFTSSGYGQVVPQPNLPEHARLLAASGIGLQLPLIGPAFFTTRTSATVTGTIAATLDAFTAALSGNVGRAAQPEPALFKPGPQGAPLPLIGPAFFALKLVTGTVAVTLGGFSSSATAGHGPNGTADDTLDGFTSDATGGTGPVGTLAVTLASFIADASGSSVTGTIAAIIAAMTCVATGTVGATEDPFPATLTVRDRGHATTIEDDGHFATFRDHGHTATFREQH